MSAQTFLVIAFPAPSRPNMSNPERIREVAPIAKRLADELRRACGEAPLMIQPDLTSICLLAHGEFDAISRAVETARASDTAAFIARVDTPTECIGLATAEGWLKRHCA